MKKLKHIALSSVAILWAGAASAHQTAISHTHPHPEIVGGDTLIVATIVGLALTAVWMSRRAR